MKTERKMGSMKSFSICFNKITMDPPEQILKTMSS